MLEDIINMNIGLEVTERLQRVVLSVASGWYGCFTDLCHGGCALMAGQEIFNKKMFFLFRGEMVRGIARLSPLCAASLSLSAFFPWMCQLLPNNGSYGL